MTKHASPNYVLHYAPDNASMIIRLALEHRRLAYRSTLVDRANYAQRSTAYRALNPAGLIPALETPEGVLFETGAILLWLGDTHGGLGPILGDKDRGDYLKWMFFTANTLHPALRMIFYSAEYIGTDPSHREALHTGLEQQITKALHLLDAAASFGPAWLGGTKTSALDFYVVCLLRWCALYPADRAKGWFNLNATPSLARICAKLECLPCTATVQAAEGLGDTPFTAPTYAKPPQGSAT